MCNLSEGIEEKGMKKGMKKGIETGRFKIYPIKWTQQEEGFLENGHKKKG